MSHLRITILANSANYNSEKHRELLPCLVSTWWTKSTFKLHIEGVSHIPAMANAPRKHNWWRRLKIRFRCIFSYCSINLYSVVKQSCSPRTLVKFCVVYALPDTFPPSPGKCASLLSHMNVFPNEWLRILHCKNQKVSIGERERDLYRSVFWCMDSAHWAVESTLEQSIPQALNSLLLNCTKTREEYSHTCWVASLIYWGGGVQKKIQHAGFFLQI